MFRYTGLGLLALLRGIRSIGYTLKSFLLRCLFRWLHVLRNLGRIWSPCLRTVPKEVTKKGGHARPSTPGALHGCDGYSVVYASRDFNREGGPHLTLEFGDTEVLHLSPMMRPSRSAPTSPSSSRAPSLHGSPRLSNRRLSVGSITPSMAGSYDADSMRLSVRRSNTVTPLTLTHSRVTSTQFAGAPRNRPRSRSRSRSPSWSPLPLPFPSRSRSPSPSRSLYNFHPQSSTHDVVPNPQDTSDGYRRGDFLGEILISPPSRSQTLELSGEQLSHHSGGSLPAGPQPASSDSDLARYRPSFPLPSTSQVSVVTIPVADASGIWSDGKTRSIRLMHSEQVSRYVNKGDISPVNSEYTLHPMGVDLPQYSFAKCPKGWTPVTHPGGAVYFYHAKQRIFTDVYMYNTILSAEIHALVAHLDGERTHLPDIPTDDYDLVLDVFTTGDDETIWAYYYVDHNTKSLFWLHDYECGDSLLREVRGVQEASHVKLRLESLYWVHWSLYPTGPNWRRFPENASNELLGALLSSGIDSLTSKVSTSPFTVAEMESMRDFIKEAQSLGTENPHAITSIARLLSLYAHWRFLHFHGQKTSRQDRYKSIYKGGHRKRTILIRTFSPILFFFPDAYLRELQKLWMDKIIVEALWKESTQRLVSEWSDFVLYSTVMLTANVAFLAIPGVIVAPQYPIPPNAWIKPSPAQIASSISLVFSIGSIITGLLLIRRSRTMITKDPNSVWHYLYGMKWPVVGLEPLAIAFSLTYALLMWSVWGFFVALLIFTFEGTSRKIWIAVGIAAGIVIITMVWCIKNTWDPEEREKIWPYELE